MNTLAHPVSRWHQRMWGALLVKRLPGVSQPSMSLEQRPQGLFLLWLSFMGLLVFAASVMGHHGLWQRLVQADPTGLTIVIVLLFTDPLELQPPAKLLPLASGTSRLELDLGSPTQRRQWMAAFSEPVRAAMAALPLRGVRVQAVSTDEPSDAWLPLLGRLRPLVA